MNIFGIAYAVIAIGFVIWLAMKDQYDAMYEIFWHVLEFNENYLVPCVNVAIVGIAIIWPVMLIMAVLISSGTKHKNKNKG